MNISSAARAPFVNGTDSFINGTISDIFPWQASTTVSETWTMVLFGLLLAACACTILIILHFVVCVPSFSIKRRAVAPCPPLPEARVVDDEHSAYSFDEEDFALAGIFHDVEQPPPMIAIADRRSPVVIARVT